MRSNDDAVVSFAVIDPVLTLPALTVNFEAFLHSKARRSFHDAVFFVAVLNQVETFFAFLHRVCPPVCIM